MEIHLELLLQDFLCQHSLLYSVGEHLVPLKPKIAGALKTQLSDVALHEQTIIASVHFKFHPVAALHLKSHIVRCKCASVVSVRTGHISGIGTAGMRNIGALCYHCCRNGKPRRVVVFVPCANVPDEDVHPLKSAGL